MGKRTTLILDDKLIEQAMKAAGTHTMTETVEIALRELIRRSFREALRRDLGTFSSLISPEELEEMRNADWRPVSDR